jgi:nitrogen fixation protein FixH
MKFSWGQGIFLVMTAFAVMMATFMYRAYHAQEDLVAENYYEQEIRYQQQIDKLDNVSKLGGKPGLDVIGDELVISFPTAVHGSRITGELYLQRPSDARFDDRIPFTVENGEELRVPVGERMKGLYTANMEWSAGDQNFLTVEKVYVP